MRITRREILKAIRTERLQYGMFITPRLEDNNRYVDDSFCKVCAVGAVLRQKGVPNHRIEDAADIVRIRGLVSSDGDEFEELKSKHYMNALSIRFEKLARKHGVGPKTKIKLSSFIKRHFPKTINVKGLENYV